jgi:rod shape determining protein RodA
MSQTRIWRHFDIWLLAAVVMLTIAGVAMIRSAIAGNIELANHDQRQAIFAMAGLIIVILFAAIDYRIWSALAHPLLIGIAALLAFIKIAGVAGFGSQRWFQVGTLYIQPSELSKIVVIIVLASFFSKRQFQINSLKVIFQSIALVGLPAFLVLIQPDLSTSIVLLVLWFALIWAAGLPLKYIAIFILILAVILVFITPLLVNYFTGPYMQDTDNDFYFIKHYQMERIANFLFPNPEESYGATYNVEQALISIGSGGLFGQGYGHGTQVQLRFLKVRHTDFIFSALAEEFGFIGAMTFIIVLLLVIHRCLRAAHIARDQFGALICYGVAFLIFFQGAFNIGMNLNIFPVSGIPLPFFSYGGSSLLTSLIGIGLVESVILRHKQIEL